YHGDPVLTAQILVDGWLDTGDRGYVANRDLYFIARDKDLIVMGGEKHAPHDIETIINAIPGVREGCTIAFGVLNEARGTEEGAHHDAERRRVVRRRTHARSPPPAAAGSRSGRS